MSIQLSTGRNNVQISDVRVQDKTQIRKITLGRPVRKVLQTGAAMSTLPDVDVSNLENGSLLIYNTNTSKWTATKDIDQGQDVNGGSY